MILFVVAVVGVRWAGYIPEHLGTSRNFEYNYNNYEKNCKIRISKIKRNKNKLVSAQKIKNKTKTQPTRSYFSEVNSVSCPERYSKAEKGWDFDVLWMRSPGLRGDLCKCVALRALIRSVARAYELWNVFTCDTSLWLCRRGGRYPLISTI